MWGLNICIYGEGTDQICGRISVQDRKTEGYRPDARCMAKCMAGIGNTKEAKDLWVTSGLVVAELSAGTP